MVEQAKVQHTPGPWRWVHHENEHYRADEPGWLAGPTAGDNVLFAPWPGLLDRHTRLVCTEANARLIAAAPDLLRALEIADEFDRDGTASDYTRADVRALIAAAIAKARGES